MALEQQPIDAPPQYVHRPKTGESTLAWTGPHLRRTHWIPFPTPCQAIGLPSTSNNDPTETSDTDTLVERDIPEAIRIHAPPDVPRDIDPDEDLRTPRELLGLEHRGEEDPFNVDGPDFEWPELAPIDREIMGQAQVTAWEFRRRDVKDRTTNHLPGPREPMSLYLALDRGEPLDTPNALPLSERLERNADRSVWDPAPGQRLLHLRPQTTDEQGALKHALSCIVWQEEPWRS